MQDLGVAGGGRAVPGRRRPRLAYRAQDDHHEHQADAAAYREEQAKVGVRAKEGERDQRSAHHGGVDRRAHDAEALGAAARARQVGDHGVGRREEHRPAEGRLDHDHDDDLQQAVREGQADVEGGASADRQRQHAASAEAVGKGAAGDLEGQAEQAGEAQDQTDQAHRDMQAAVQEQRLERIAHVDADDVHEDAAGQQPELRGELTEAVGRVRDGAPHRLTRPLRMCTPPCSRVYRRAGDAAGAHKRFADMPSRVHGDRRPPVCYHRVPTLLRVVVHGGHACERPPSRARGAEPASVVAAALPAARPAHDRRGAHARRPRGAHLLRLRGADRLARRGVGRSRGHLVDDLDGAGRLRPRRAAARAGRAHRDRRFARHLRRRRGARARRLRGARRGRRSAHARADRRPAGRSRARHDRRSVVQPRRPPRAQRGARAGGRLRRAAGPRPEPDRGSRAPQVDAHHDELGLPVRLQLLLRDGHVRPQVPVPQPRGGGRRARRQEAPPRLLLRRQLRRRQAAAEDVAAPDDRPRPDRVVAGPDAHRRHARRRAARPHATVRLSPRGPGSGVGRPGDPRRLPQVADGGRRGHRHPSPARLRHRLPRHVRAGLRDRHRQDGGRHRALCPGARHRHPDAQHPHAGPRHATVRRHGGRGAHLRARLEPLRRAARGLHAAAAHAARPAGRRAARLRALLLAAPLAGQRRALAVPRRARQRLVLLVRQAVALGGLQPRLPRTTRGAAVGRRRRARRAAPRSQARRQRGHAPLSWLRLRVGRRAWRRGADRRPSGLPLLLGSGRTIS